MKKRNLDPNRTIHFQIDTDGYCGDVIEIYKEIGCDYMSPFEVASNCDVVKLGQKYPDLRMSGGIDKRIIAKGGDDIKRPSGLHHACHEKTRRLYSHLRSWSPRRGFF